VTFSTPEIQNAIANNFVALNSNIEGDPLAGESIGHAPNETPGDCIRGNGRQNVQTIFLTPDLELFHVATGFVSPEEMYEELAFAAKLFEELQQEDENRFDLVRLAHQTKLNKLPASSRSAVESGLGAARDFVNSMDGRDSGLGSMARNPMQAFSNRFMSDDHRYMVKHPLISKSDFEKDPGALVGRGKTFFSSSKNSSSSR